jgi:hypothetical protein
MKERVRIDVYRYCGRFFLVNDHKRRGAEMYLAQGVRGWENECFVGGCWFSVEFWELRDWKYYF